MWLEALGRAQKLVTGSEAKVAFVIRRQVEKPPVREALELQRPPVCHVPGERAEAEMDREACCSRQHQCGESGLRLQGAEPQDSPCTGLFLRTIPRPNILILETVSEIVFACLVHFI